MSVIPHVPCITIALSSVGALDPGVGIVVAHQHFGGPGQSPKRKILRISTEQGMTTYLYIISYLYVLLWACSQRAVYAYPLLLSIQTFEAGAVIVLRPAIAVTAALVFTVA